MHLHHLLAGIAADPCDDTGWLALADWLEEQGDARQGEQGELTRLLTWLRRHAEDPGCGVREVRLRTLLRQGVRPRVPAYTDPVGISFALIPPGTFRMGSPETDSMGQASERPSHLVTLTRPFYLSTYPVTCGQWRLVLGLAPATSPAGHHPITHVSWHDACHFCSLLEERQQRRYRLPTEAEWEYACRAGTTTQYYTGDGLEALERAGWFWSNSGYTTHPVGLLQPNAFGLYDLSGNVWEWCADRFRADAYGSQACADPRGPERGETRVRRGGAFNHESRGCRSASRGNGSMNERTGTVGLRVVLEVV